MERKVVTSSQIKSIGYDKKTKILEVEFNGGGIYQYEKVSAKTHENLMKAESTGSAFHKLIKKGGYTYKMLPKEIEEIKHSTCLCHPAT